MNNRESAFHYVCTRDQVRELVRRYVRFRVMNCACGEARGQCAPLPIIESTGPEACTDSGTCTGVCPTDLLTMGATHES